MPDALTACPCCGYATLDDRGHYDICAICFWEDDGQDNDDADTCWGGPNGVSLSEARLNFLTFGAAEHEGLPHVRAPGIRDRRLRVFAIEDGKALERAEALRDPT
ncbi:hypothetical protein JY651_17175 [Pyxidicoccus parkwayensis]|uniref:Cysteine-rich CPCC domain-containing protein n=1 Tax=Pyxidicoccus parkwayensis TaxID=2813578 RepID=A0ABX7P7X3_9BACT|nr:CPCC family cysteine-rich protein [Pyxidicoccus parkwaysis]QSQ26555.1 hypothetical protein JY651_17175 [Pyxidicoccus parkwaysis]